MSREHEHGLDRLPLAERVALAVRAGRRREGLSQRDLAQVHGWSQSRVSRLETRAGSMPLDTVREAVEWAGFELTVTVMGREPDVSEWEHTDLDARDRRGRRFPAQRTVYRSPEGPFWWWEQEYIRLSRPLGPQPLWTTVARDFLANREARAADDDRRRTVERGKACSPAATYGGRMSDQPTDHGSVEASDTSEVE